MEWVITSARDVAAPPAVVHALLVDVGAWRLWSPHLAWIEREAGPVGEGETIGVRAWFSPTPTPMRIAWVRPDGGMGWESEGLGHRLHYEHRVDPGHLGSEVTFRAWVQGPRGAGLTRLAAPLSAWGQRQRLARLGRLAELTVRVGGPGA